MALQAWRKTGKHVQFLFISERWWLKAHVWNHVFTHHVFYARPSSHNDGVIKVWALWKRTKKPDSKEKKNVFLWMWQWKRGEACGTSSFLGINANQGQVLPQRLQKVIQVQFHPAANIHRKKKGSCWWILHTWKEWNCSGQPGSQRSLTWWRHC